MERNSKTMYVNPDAYYLCNRCRQKIDFHNHALFKAERPIIKGSLLRRDAPNIRVGEMFPKIEFDLCPKCADEFMKWMKTEQK